MKRLLLLLLGLGGCHLGNPMDRVLQPDPGDRFQVWAFTSPDRHRLTRRPRPVAHGLPRLGPTAVRRCDWPRHHPSTKSISPSVVSICRLNKGRRTVPTCGLLRLGLVLAA